MSELTESGRRRTVRAGASRELWTGPGVTVDRARQSIGQNFEQNFEQTFHGTSAVPGLSRNRRRWFGPGSVALLVVVLGFGLILALFALVSVQLAWWLVDWMTAVA